MILQRNTGNNGPVASTGPTAVTQKGMSTSLGAALEIINIAWPCSPQAYIINEDRSVAFFDEQHADICALGAPDKLAVVQILWLSVLRDQYLNFDRLVEQHLSLNRLIAGSRDEEIQYVTAIGVSILYGLAQPRGVVLVGRHAERYCPGKSVHIASLNAHIIRDIPTRGATVPFIE